MKRLLAIALIATALLPVSPVRATSGLVVSDLSLTAVRRDVVIAGTVTNTGDRAISSRIKAVSGGAITTRTDLDKLLQGNAPGRTSELTPYTYRVANLAPKASARWSITVPLRAIKAPTSSAVMALGVSLDGQSSLVATPIFTSDTHRVPTKVSLGIRISTSALHLDGNSAKNDELDTLELARIGQLVVPGPWTLLVDPAVYVWLRDFRGGPHDEEAQAIESAIKASSSRNTIFADADLGRLVSSGRTAVAETLFENATEAEKPLYIPAEVSPHTVVALANAATSVATNTQISGSKLNTTPAFAQTGTVPILIRDEGLEDCFRDSRATSSCVTATLAMMTSESPNNSRHILAVTPRDWNPAPNVLTSLRKDLSSTYATAAALTPTVTSPQQVSWNSSDPAAFDATFIRTFDRLLRAASDTTLVFPDVTAGEHLRCSAFAATADIYDAKQSLEILRAATWAADSELNRVSIETSSRFTIPGQEAQIPITVANNSNYSARVAVSVVPVGSGRITSTVGSAVSIDAGQKVTLPLTISITGVGTVQAAVHLTTSSGSTFGEGESIVITTTAYQSFARNLVWLALASLLLLATRSWVLRRKSTS